MGSEHEFQVALKDLEDVKARDRMLEKISIYSILVLFVVYTSQSVSFRMIGGFLAVLLIFSILKNRQYEALENEIKKECREM